MRTGVFQKLLDKLEGKLVCSPENKHWDANCFFSHDFSTN